MKLRNLALVLLIAPAFAYADEPNYTELMIIDDTITSDNIPELVILDKQFDIDKHPEFPGGNNGMMQFLSENIVYPTECIENGIEGKVLVRFVIFKNGKVNAIEVVNPVHPLLDAEAVRVVSLMPDWKPAELNGMPINVMYTLPINFKLQEDDPRISESDKFVALGDEALALNNSDHAFAYYKEAFDILPFRFNLIDKCESLISGNTERHEAFYRWAVSRLMREAQLNWDVADSYITQMVKLQEKIVERHPNDFEMLLAMEFLYYQANDFDKVKSTAQKLYPIIPTSDIAALVDAIEMDANSRYISQDYNGVVALVAPNVDILLSQPVDTAQFGPFLELLDSYIHLNKLEDAKKLLLRLKSTSPTEFDRLLNIHAEYEPELHPKVLEILK